MLSAFGVDHGEVSKAFKSINPSAFARGGSNAMEDSRSARLAQVAGKPKTPKKGVQVRSSEGNRTAGSQLMSSKFKSFGAPRSRGY